MLYKSSERACHGVLGTDLARPRASRGYRVKLSCEQTKPSYGMDFVIIIAGISHSSCPYHSSPTCAILQVWTFRGLQSFSITLATFLCPGLSCAGTSCSVALILLNLGAVISAGCPVDTVMCPCWLGMPSSVSLVHRVQESGHTQSCGQIFQH